VRAFRRFDEPWCSLKERCSTVIGTVVLLAVGVAGCASVSSSDWFPSIPGFSNVVTTSADRSALASAQPTPPSMDENCPSADVRQGASTLAIATKTQQATGSDLRYQLSITQLARQMCARGAGDQDAGRRGRDG